VIESNDLIERWTNVERVLDAMPEHERQRHWNMGTWGEINDCGTIACAAGHCGLDPWFRERGFTLNFCGGQSEISNVESFFGLEGTSRIFHNTTQRSVETVANEVRTYITELRQLHSLSTAIGLPKIGEEWSDQGGIFAGALLGRDGAPNEFLLVGPEREDSCDWDRAVDWAKTLTVGNFSDFELPDRSQQRALFDRVKSLFRPTSYWSREQHASLSDYAWGQDFGDGCQGHWDEDNELRARAVRSIPIQ
jgi:hypothetical protein